jgi:hypothetical protein
MMPAKTKEIKKPYPDIEWLTANRWAEILEQAADYGAVGYKRYTDGFDWEDLVSLFETESEPWPSDWSHPMFSKFKRVVRAAWRESK